MPSPSPDPESRPLTGHLVVFTGKLSTLGRKDACALVSRLGGDTADDVTARTTMLVVGAEGFGASPQGDKSQKLKRAEELNAQRREHRGRHRRGVLPPRGRRDAGDAEASVLRDARPPRPLSRLREDHLRYLMKCGLIHPATRTNADMFFAFPDVSVIRQANEGLSDGATFRSVVRSLTASRHGQLAFDFRLDAAPAKILELRRADRPSRAGRRARPGRRATPRSPRNTSAPARRSTTGAN